MGLNLIWEGDVEAWVDLAALLVPEMQCKRRGWSLKSMSAAEAFAELPAGLHDLVASPSEGCG